MYIIFWSYMPLYRPNDLASTEANMHHPVSPATPTRSRRIHQPCNQALGNSMAVQPHMHLLHEYCWYNAAPAMWLHWQLTQANLVYKTDVGVQNEGFR